MRYPLFQILFMRKKLQFSRVRVVVWVGFFLVLNWGLLDDVLMAEVPDGALHFPRYASWRYWVGIQGTTPTDKAGLDRSALESAFIEWLNQLNMLVLQLFFSVLTTMSYMTQFGLSSKDQNPNLQSVYGSKHEAAVLGFGLPCVLLLSVPLAGALLFFPAQAASALLVLHIKRRER